MKKVVAVLVLFSVLFVLSAARAQNFETALSIATYNVPPGADVASMGNVWTATPNFSSNNPAILPTCGDYKIGGSATYGRINFKNGPDINLYSGSVAAKMPIGYLQVTYSDANSGIESTKMDVDAKFNSSPSLNIQYGLKVAKDFLRKGDELDLGISYSPYARSKMTFSLGGQDLLVSKSKGYLLGAGFLYKPVKDLNLGGFYSYSRSKNSDHDLIFNEIIMSVSESEQLRLGVGYQITPSTFVAFDYQHLEMDNGSKDQYFVGIEQGIVKDIMYLYGGWADSGPTGGLGVYFKNGGINIAYMRNPFNELKPYLGRANVIMATAYVNF